IALLAVGGTLAVPTVAQAEPQPSVSVTPSVDIDAAADQTLDAPTAIEPTAPVTATDPPAETEPPAETPVDTGNPDGAATLDDSTEPDETAPVWGASLEVFAADGVTPLGDSPVFDGDTVVVRGSGFDPAATVGGRGVPI